MFKKLRRNEMTMVLEIDTPCENPPTPENDIATTDDLQEGSENLYFTQERAQEALSEQLGGKVDKVTASENSLLVSDGQGGLKDTNINYNSLLKSYQTATLPAANWSAKQQIVSVTGVTANNNIIVTPGSVRANLLAYGNAQISAISQGAGTITFECTTIPTLDLTVNVQIQ
jgi:hypothetical protein